MKKTINEDEELNRLGKNLKKLRIKKGLSQIALANMCGIDSKNFGRIEAGKANPTFKTLFTIAATLEVPFAALIK